MNIERAVVALRPRGGWEALDLGFVMAREWWKPIWAAWLSVYLPAAVLLHLVLYEYPWLAVALLWWLKPAFDRVVLQVASRAVFDDRQPLREVLRDAKHWLRPGLLAALTLYRLDLSRSLMLPVWQLEKQTGADARERRKLLGKRMRGHGVWLTVVCANFEGALMLSFGVLAALLAPAGPDAGFDPSEIFRAGDSSWDVFDSVCYVLAVSLIEPFYVCAGFSLYLNRRALLEGWDIELELRKLAERLRRVGVAATVCLLLAFTLTVPAPTLAADQSPKEEAKAVLASPDFEEFREVKRWSYRGDKDAQTKQPVAPFWLQFGKFLAEIAQVLGWIAVGAVVIALLWFLRRHIPAWREAEARAYQPPDALFGLDLAPDSLPADVGRAAGILVREGKIREALSLLYRGALSTLAHRDHVRLAEGYTEGDCLIAARGALPPEGTHYFAQLVQAWRDAAYAGRLPDGLRARELCREWTPHFGRPQ